MKNILIIDDNADLRENTSELLTISNYNVFSAPNGEIGIKLAHDNLPDLILCDIMMPKMDGYEVLNRLSTNSKTALIPFVFLTAKSNREDIRYGMNMGADDYLTKPFNQHELLGAIETRLKKHDFLIKEMTSNKDGLIQFLDEANSYLDLESLSKDFSIKIYKKRDLVFMEDRNANTLYFIEKGVVKTYKAMESGKEFVTGLYGPGDFMGQLSLLNKDGIYTETAIALEDSEICEIPKKEFLKLLYSNQVVSNKFINIISNNMISMQEQLRDMAYASVRQRAATCLLDLYNKGLVKSEKNSGIGIPREDFAGIIGTATETAIRTLSDFRDEGLVATDQGRRILIINKQGLRNVAEFG